MNSVVIDRQILPEPIFSYIHSEKIRVFEENGNIILSPIVEKYSIIEQAFGMFSDGKLSSEDFIFPCARFKTTAFRRSAFSVNMREEINMQEK
jgi:hypothetical protein